MLLLFLLSLAPARLSADPALAPDGPLLVHVTSRLDAGSSRTAPVFRVIAAALQKGRPVALLFDADGVASIRKGRWFGGHSTPIDRVPIGDEDREYFAVLLGSPPEELPDIYGSLLHFLKGRGLAVYVNTRALEVYGIPGDGFDHAAEAVSEQRIIELLGSAAAQVTY